jgi:ubiquitin-conjugating enzyme E2 W
MAKRLQKDLEQMQKNYVDQFQVQLVNNNIKHWVVAFQGAQGGIYQNEKFQ